MDEFSVSDGDRTVAARVFLSYAAEDLPCAERLASILTDRGWDVWWDRRLFAGTSFDEVIEQELDEARAVIVLWSTTSVQSEWVRAEATTAIERAVLIPVIIEPCRVPLRFRNVHTLDLSDWNGDPLDDRFAGLERALGNLTLADARPDQLAPEQPFDRLPTSPERVADTAAVDQRRPPRVWVWSSVAAVLAVAVVLGLIAVATSNDASPPDPQSTGPQETIAPQREDENVAPPPDDQADGVAEDRNAPSDIRSDGIDPGEWLFVGDTRVSTNGRFLLRLQNDGNLVVEDNDDPPAPPIWSSGTAGHPNAGALMQEDGNFIIFGDRSADDLQATVVFKTQTAGHDGAVLTIRNDGALVVESPTGAVLFATNA